MLPGIGKICKSCSNRGDPAIAFQSHMFKCWNFTEGDIVLDTTACLPCKAYDAALGEPE